MPTSVRLNSTFVSHAKVHAQAENRSVPKQIEYWAKIGQIMSDNADLSYAFVRESLLSLQEVKEGQVTPYVRQTTVD